MNEIASIFDIKEEAPKNVFEYLRFLIVRYGYTKEQLKESYGKWIK